MTIIKRLNRNDELLFHNVSAGRLTMTDVCERIMSFMAQDPRRAYHFMIGTDCQVHRGYMKFVTGVIIHRLGQGAWACYRQAVIPREMSSIKEKLTMETALSQEVAWHFADGPLERMEELLLPHIYQGASLETYIDIDAGREPIVNRTSLYVHEMVERVEAMERFAARIKPDAYAASAYANRHTKRPYRGAL